jgi:hypothetical protein
MKYSFEFFGGMAILLLMAFTLAQIIEPTSLSNSVSVYEEMTENNIETTTELPVACTKDAMTCSDGSSVGRVAPDCVFASCPITEIIPPPTGVVLCPEKVRADRMCLAVYQPVCGSFRGQCSDIGCSIEQKTFGNGCNACSQKDVISYTEGECGIESSTI